MSKQKLDQVVDQVGPAEAYKTALLSVIDEARRLRGMIGALSEAARGLKSFEASGIGPAVGLSRDIDKALTGWKWTVPDVMGVAVRDPAAEAVREAQTMLDRQRSFLAWAESLPNDDRGKSGAVKLFREQVQTAEKLLKRAKGEAVEEDAEAFGERLDQLIGQLGSIRRARLALGLEVEAERPRPEFPWG